MYGVEWLIGLGILGSLAAAGGYLLGRRGSGTGSRRVQALERELAQARQELADYRREVAAQFSETARKFRTLNESYSDLHQQLARSSSLLCGDAAGPLLPGPAEPQVLLGADDRERGNRDRMAGAAADEPADTGPAREDGSEAPTDQHSGDAAEAETEADPADAPRRAEAATAP